jgi:outer membrane protein TolC
MATLALLALTAATAAATAPAVVAAPNATPNPAQVAAPARTLSLDEALRELDAQSLTLAQARSRAEAARGVVRQAAAPLLPTLTASGNYTHNSDQVAVGLGSFLAQLPPAIRPASIPPNILIQPLDVLSATGTVRVPLLVPSAWFDLGAARGAADASDASASAVGLEVRAALSQSAWFAAMGEEILAASERAVETSREQERSARRTVAAGTAAPLSILQAQTETTKRESDLVRARSDLERARLALGVFLGRAEPVRILLPPPRPAEGAAPEALAAEALTARPELRAQDALVRSAQSQLASARWRIAPQLAATGSAFAATQPYPTQKNEGWRVTVDLVWPLYDGGYRYGKAGEAAALLAGAEAARGAQRLEVIQQVKDAAREVDVARERQRLGERQRELAAETAASAKRSFEAGVAGSIEVLDANDRLYQSEVALASARGQLGAAQVALDRAVGRAP